MITKITTGLLAAFLSFAQTKLPDGSEIFRGSGSIAGTVVDENRTPVAGAVVAVSKSLGPAEKSSRNASFQPFRSLAVAGTDGTFLAERLPAGYFQICVQVPKSDFVEDCLWADQAADATLADGQAVKLAAIILRKGYRLQIRVEDSSQVVSRTTPLPPGPGLRVGVFPAGRPLVTAVRKSADEGGLDYEVLVPYQRAMRAVVYSQVLRLTDAEGKAGDEQGIAISIPASENAKAVTLVKAVITGIRR